MTSLLFSLCLILPLAALIKTVLDRRSAGSFPLQTLLRDRFSTAGRAGPANLLGVLAGSASILIPYILFSRLGWVQSQLPGSLPMAVVLLMALTLVVKLIWAALEELIFRGSLLPQVAKWAPAGFGIIFSALLFAFGHLEGRSANPNMLSLLVYFLDGVGFSLVFLAARSLWPALLWHAAKNIWIWLLFSESTLQFAPGILRTDYTGPALWVGSPGQAGLTDVLVTAAIVGSAAVILRNSLKRNPAWLKEQ